MADADAADKIVTKAEHLKRAKDTFALVQYIRINGGIRSANKIAEHLGVSLGIPQLQDLEKLCKRADISRGASYVQTGLVYGLSIYTSELGWRVSYVFLCRADDP
ncbi:MAG: hypothetical protein ACM33T_08895 [Solirubrobacterales bacterium]